MKKITFFSVLLVCLLGLSLTACQDTTPPVDYNAVASSDVIADASDALLKCSYNADGRFLAVVKADFSTNPSDFGESVRLNYDESGLLSSIYVRENIFGTDVPVTLTDGKLPASVKKDELEVRLTSDGDRIQKMLILDKGVMKVELSFDSAEKLASITKYEDGDVSYTTGYTYENGKTVASATLPESQAFSATLTYDGEGRPLSYAGTIQIEDALYTMSGNWRYDTQTLFTLRLSDGASSDLNNEYCYSFDESERRTEEKLTIETYENKKLTDKAVFTKKYNASGEYLSSTSDSYKDAILLEKSFTEYYEWTGVTTQSSETSYRENGKRASVFEIYLLDDGRTSKTVLYTYDDSDQMTSKYEETFRYNANGEKIEQTSTTYNAKGKAEKATILIFDIFGSILTREEITYSELDLLGIKIKTEEYKKYDASGNLIDSGTRETK